MQCAPTVHVQTMQALVKTESGFNPFAIGVVNGRLERQPANLREAVATVQNLERQGYNYSVGYAQVNKYNWKKYGLTSETAFEPCSNLRAGSGILTDCFVSAKGKFRTDLDALHAALSCYYSGNFIRGFQPDGKGQSSYVERVIANGGMSQQRVEIPVGAITVHKVQPAQRGKAADSASLFAVTKSAAEVKAGKSSLVF